MPNTQSKYTEPRYLVEFLVNKLVSKAKGTRNLLLYKNIDTYQINEYEANNNILKINK